MDNIDRRNPFAVGAVSRAGALEVHDSYGDVTLTITTEEIGDYLEAELERMRGAATPHVERLVELAIARIKQLERVH